VEDLIGGAFGAGLSADTDHLLSQCHVYLGDLAAAARAAVSSLHAARAAGNRTFLVIALCQCGEVAQLAPVEMIKMETEYREREGALGACLHSEGRISLPTTARATRSKGVAYLQAALSTCTAAVGAAGGRGSPAAADQRRVPTLLAELMVRNSLAACLAASNKERPRATELRELVSLARQTVQTAAQCDVPMAQRMLADRLSSLGGGLTTFEGFDEADACLHESLALSECVGDVQVLTGTLRQLVNIRGNADTAVAGGRYAEAEEFRSRLNALLVQKGRSIESHCSICLELLTQPVVGGGVLVLGCNHQFHTGCILAWQATTPVCSCPMCKQ